MKKFAALLALTGMATLGNTYADTKPTIALVHGAFENAGIWQGVEAGLKADGYQVIVPTLPGRVGNPATPDKVSLNLYRDTVLAAIGSTKAPVVLVGHSFGGIVISDVAEAKPAKIRSLVYLAAYLPKDGDSLLSLATADKDAKIGPQLQIDKENGIASVAQSARASERRLAAATADVGVATADLFPRVSLSGFLGFTAGRGSQIGSSAARAWGLGPSITWAAFDLGSVRAQIRGAKADAEGALSSYEQTVLLALEESENAFSDYSKRQERLVSLIRQSESSRSAASLASVQYTEGAADYLILLDAERERLSAEDSQAVGETDQFRSVVAIYKALGGGWDVGGSNVEPTTL